MFDWRPVMATMIAIDGSYWELFLVHQILWREMLLGDQIQGMLAQLTLQQFGGGKSVHLNDLKAIGVIGIVGIIGVYHKYSRID
jgi:hypothetical protein